VDAERVVLATTLVGAVIVIVVNTCLVVDHFNEFVFVGFVAVFTIAFFKLFLNTLDF
jgi:hypothetical protein